MKKIIAIVAIIIMIPVVFILGLRPAERLLSRNNPGSTVLIGQARASMVVSGMYEFFIGAAAATALLLVIRKK